MKENASKGTKGKIWIIGLDGATFRLIKPWTETGKLPAFARMLKGGSHGLLKSPVPQSPPAWASFMTGCNPGKHGIFDWIQPFPHSYEEHVLNGTSRGNPSLWRILSDLGRRIGVVNVPMTFPPEEVNGILVSGLDTPYGSEEFTHPPAFFNDLSTRFGSYTILPVITGIPLEQTFLNFMDTIGQREKVMHFLLDSHEFDFFILVFNATDCLQHLCLTGFEEKEMKTLPMQALLSVYQRLDAVLSNLLTRLPDDVTLFVVSDHGAGPVRAYLNLDSWLAGEGWLCFAEKSRRLAMKQKRAQVFEWARRGFHKFLPDPIRSRIRERAGGLKALLDRAASAPYLDWEHTMAFCFDSQGIYLNVKGRQPSGRIQSGLDYEKWCARISDALYGLRDPELGSPVVARVYRKEEIFSGPFLDVAPDLYIHWVEDAYLSWKNPLHPRDRLLLRPKPLGIRDKVSQRDEGNHVGCHRQDGIFIAYGAHVREGQEISGSSILDVAPTALYLMGEAVPSHMDGQVIRKAIDDDFLKRNPLRSVELIQSGVAVKEGYSSDEIKRAKEKLRDLGYL